MGLPGFDNEFKENMKRYWEPLHETCGVENVELHEAQRLQQRAANASRNER